MRLFLTMALLLISVVRASAEIVALPAGGAPIPDDLLSDDRVSGVTVRWRWQEIQKSPARIDWTYFDREIERVGATGKWVFLKITAGGRNVPDFVRDTALTSFEWDDPEDGRTRFPAFWDRVFLTFKESFISAMGRRYAAHPAVRAVGVHCANARTDDWNVPHTAADIEQWRRIGYTSERLVEACKRTIQATMSAFPQKLVVLPISSNGKLDPDPDYVARTVAEWAFATYPGRFMAAKHSLNARTPRPEDAGAGWLTLYRLPAIHGQMLWSVTGDPTCRMAVAVPCDPVQTLDAAIQTGWAYGMRFLEIYGADLRNPELDGVIR